MNVCLRRPRAVTAVSAIVTAALVVVSLMSLAGPTAASAPAQEAGKCVGIGEITAFPNSTECGEFDLEAQGQPLCEACRGGLRVVFVQREQATDARWQNNESTAVLDRLTQLGKQGVFAGALQAGVVYYGPGTFRVAQRMTADLNRVRSALQRSTAVSNPPDHNNSAGRAADEAVKLLNAPDDGVDGPCRLVLFFAQDSPTPG